MMKKKTISRIFGIFVLVLILVSCPHGTSSKPPVSNDKPPIKTENVYISALNANYVRFMAIDGAQYKLGNGKWQNSPSFTGLESNKEYTGTIKISNGTEYSKTFNTPSTQAIDLNGEEPGFGWAKGDWDLGAFYDGTNTAHFAVYSKNATRMRLEIYSDAYGKDFLASFLMEKGNDDIWRAKIEALPATVYYGFRAWGANWSYTENWTIGNSSAGFKSDVDSAGNRFNPNKLLFDPYARELSHDKDNRNALGSFNAGMFGTGGDDFYGVARRNFDTGRYAPKAIIVDDDKTKTGTSPKHPQKDAIIYEAQLRGLTNHPSTASLTSILSGFEGFSGIQNIPEEYRGTYKGASYMIPYLKGLGINTIELLPVHETDNDANPSDSPGGNFWGYMTYGFFAPDRRYSFDKSPGGPTREFKEMVKAFHDAGMEVYLDVVYNHSGEGGTWDASGNTAELTFFRGLDNSEYYALVQDDKKWYWETTGCGNNMRCDNVPVRKLILDSLRYWIDEMGIDGFRFDLATVLGREFAGNSWNFNSNAKTLTDIASLGNEKNVKMIAEAWDTATYQVGNFPSGWAEWNGRYRDVSRNYLKGDTIEKDGLDYWGAFYGDFDHFNDQGGPDKSINLLDAHDGFTLADLVSYVDKNNDIAWPFGPSDGGADDNDSWDSTGVFDLTGLTDQEFRRQRFRNNFVWLFMSRGTPMIVYGDEFGRTQNGNNNPYNIDSVATWNNYNMIKTDSPHSISTGGKGSYHNNFGTDSHSDSKNALFLFAQYMIQLRAGDSTLRQDNYEVPIYLKKEDGNDGLDAKSDRCAIIHIDGTSNGGSYYLILSNMWEAEVTFTIPSGKTWKRLVDTAHWAEENNNFWTSDHATISSSYGVKPWSMVVLKAN